MPAIEVEEIPMSGDRGSGGDTEQRDGHESQIRGGDFEGSGVGSNSAAAAAAVDE